MKKTFKRLGAVLLAAFMLLSTTICALADDNTQTGTPTTGKTITLNVSNVADGDTVSAYKLVSYNTTGNGYEFNEGFESYINTKKAESQTAEQYLASLDAAGVNKLLEGYATECNTGTAYNLPTTSASATATNGNASLKLDAGYYLLLTTTSSTNSKVYTPLSAFVKVDGENLVVYAGSNTKALTAEQDGSYKVSAKFEDGPTIDKKTNATKSSEDAAWKDTAAAGVGDIVRFYVAVTIPKYNNVSALNLTVNDTLTNLKYKDGSVKVYQNEPNVKGNNTSDTEIQGAIKNSDKVVVQDYTVTDGTGKQSLKFELDYAKIMEGATQSKTVYVYYEAIMQKESVVEKKHSGENVATLTYSNAAKPDSEHTTDKKQTNVYNYYLSVNKVKNDTEEALKGAMFSLYPDKTSKDAIKFVKATDTDGTEYYRPAAEGESGAVTVLEANFRIRGLDANTYYLEEVETPKGYTKPKDRFKTTLTSKLDENNLHTGKLDAAASNMTSVNDADKNLIIAGINNEVLHQFDATIKNFSTPNLPTTGGTGTVLLSIGGVVLMAAGAYLLFFRKKKEN
ncbi:SpaA isopeptide-forming pilin-related protein [Butyricicoccus sp.]|uniref:SpaA isopeptide-forming pilin-related protein n=2 Tax=Butyricicoccus sp. TaxID=2049021 RepID=UPI003AF9BBDB